VELTVWLPHYNLTVTEKINFFQPFSTAVERKYLEEAPIKFADHLVVADWHGRMHDVANHCDLCVEGGLGLLHLNFFGCQSLLNFVCALHELLQFLFLVALQTNTVPSRKTHNSEQYHQH